MQEGDIIRITDVQTLEGYTKEILNVYYYQVFSLNTPVELPVAAQEIAVDFRTNVLEIVAEIQVEAITHIRLDFMNMSSQMEIATYNWNSPFQGNQPDDYPPGNLSYSFRLQRTSRLTRNGRKAIAGVPDSAVIAGRTLGPSYVSAVSAVSSAIGSFFNVETDDGLITLNPVIVRLSDTPGVPPLRTNPVLQAVFRGFGTQNSRKEL